MNLIVKDRKIFFKLKNYDNFNNKNHKNFFIFEYSLINNNNDSLDLILESIISFSKEDEMNNFFEKIYKEKIYKFIDNNSSSAKKLNSSKTFKIIFSIIKEKNVNKDEDEIFKEAEENFKKLKFIFKKNWINILDDTIIKSFFKALKFMKNKEILNEIKFMKDYFELNEINDII